MTTRRCPDCGKQYSFHAKYGDEGCPWCKKKDDKDEIEVKVVE